MNSFDENQLSCKSFDTKSADATISISGRLRLFGFHSVGTVVGANATIIFKNKDRSGDVVAVLGREPEGRWGAYKCVYNFGPNGILFPDGLFVDTKNTTAGYITNSSFFYQGA